MKIIKKLICIILVLTICAGMSITALANNTDYEIDTSYFREGIKGKGTETDIYLFLTDEYYRDRLASVYVQDIIGSIKYVTIFIVEGYEDVKHEIISLMSPSYIIEFHYTIYSLNQKQAALDEILLEADENILSAKFSLDFIAIEIEVVKEHWEKYSNVLTQRYGYFINVNPHFDEPILSDGIPGQGIIEDPVEYWEQNGYPDYISFAFEGGGMLDVTNRYEDANGEVHLEGINYSFWIIGIVGDNEADEQAVINMIAPTCLITFEKCTYSYNERKIAYQGILALEDENFIDVVLLSNDERVLVMVPDDLIEMYHELLTAEFGGMVWVSEDIRATNQGSSGWGDSLLPGNINDVTSPVGTLNPIFWIISAGLVFILTAAAVVFIYRPHFTRVLQPNNGAVVSKDTPTYASKKQIVSAIEKSAKIPSDKVYATLKERIGNLRK